MSYYSEVLANWIPYKLSKSDDGLLCNWLNLSDKKIEEPFFDDTILKCRAMPQNAKPYKCFSSLSVLPSWSSTFDTVHPTAFIFHISRCGSTLVSQLLSIDGQNIVLPEVPFFDELLRLEYQQPDISIEQGDEWLQAAVQLYGQKRNGTEKNLFIKTDCWHIFFYERLRKLYPAVPFILLYRSPEEVLYSQQKRRGMQSVPGMVEPELIGINTADIQYHDFDHYFSMVLERVLQKFYEVAKKDTNTLLVNYNEGILPIVKKIAANSNVLLSDNMLLQMNDRSRYHAKYPGQVFSEVKKEEELPTYLAQSMNWYQRLEEKRDTIFSKSSL